MIALDLFAGTGWGVACQRLGITEYGVEIMPEAQAVREANGMTTIYSDVWHGLTPGRVEAEAIAGAYDLLIASPPCQTFSMAGGGAGRRALDEVLGLIDSKAYRDVERLREFGERHDPRTALVLTPLAHVYQDTPTFVAFEQVPQVLPVWERCAEEMRAWGYSVWVGVLSAEQYGVPQTRKRALLIARADGVEAKPPTPTHSRYYSHAPERLDEGVAPWVSMAEALGRARDGGTYFHPMSYARRAIWPNSEPAPTIRGVIRDMPEGYQLHPRDAVVMRSNYGSGGDPANRGERGENQPAPSITGKADRNKWTHGETGEAIKLDPAKPATTVQGDPRLTAREHHHHGEQNATSTRVTAAEASTLQSYPSDFTWAVDVRDPKTGKLKPITKTKQFLQIGNAVPPLLAEAILREVTS